jgi:hypothetical protein
MSEYDPKNEPKSPNEYDTVIATGSNLFPTNGRAEPENLRRQELRQADPDLIQLRATPQEAAEFVILDDALGDVFARFDMPRLGGASGRGWSYYSSFQRCPYFFRLRQVGARGRPAAALEIGSCFHTFLALHYTWMIDSELRLTPEVCRDELLRGGTRAEVISEAWRIYEAYASFYESDYLLPLAVEELAIDPETNSCRYDMIATVAPGHPSVPAGTWIVEHKTAKAFTNDVLEGWWNDGEIMGQIAIWQRAKLQKRFGKLRGVIVNICGKQKIPQFHRVVIPVQAWHMRQHADDLRVWRALIGMCEATGTWPRARASCVTRYGLCEFFRHCAENKKPEKPKK